MANSHAILLVAAVTLAAIFIGSAEAKKYNCPKWYKDYNPRKPECETCVARDVAAKNINNDAKNCGCCGKPCKQVPFAETRSVNGKCCEPVCKTGYTNCDKNIWSNGCETCVARDVNCGACSNVCKQVANAVTLCQNGKCGTLVCIAGWSNYDGTWENGCETATGEDAANYGACRNVCTQYPNAVTSCRSGTCPNWDIICEAGFGNCNSPDMAGDGCEAEVISDVDNCGSCGYKCPKTVEGSEVSCR